MPDHQAQLVAVGSAHGAATPTSTTTAKASRCILLCVDEKTGVRALDRTALSRPLPGVPQRVTHAAQ
jgi:hypothetical protein